MVTKLVAANPDAVTATPLPIITAHARAGALDNAWALFSAGGYCARGDDPAALAVKGRLLKDRALRASGAERAALLREAMAAYAAADVIAPAPYLLINVATLAVLAGDADRAAIAAGVVLTRLDGASPIADTPYWLAATRAEALLLLGDAHGAATALRAALSHDGESWGDHAATIRQLALICAATGSNTDWLDPFRPPASLHFAGHLGVAADADAAAPLRAQIDQIIEQRRIGFGYGALAAGSDIMIAESLIAHGSELHVTLPTTQDAFEAQSVAPYGAAWTLRYRACLERATTIRAVAAIEDRYDSQANALAGEAAMGAAAMNAQMLESHAVQLLIIDEGDGHFGSGKESARHGDVWAAAGRAQDIIRWPRNAPVVASGISGTGPPSARHLVATLHLDFDGFGLLTDQQIPLFVDKVLSPVASVIKGLGHAPASLTTEGQALSLGFEGIEDAASAALTFRTVMGSIDFGGLGLPPSLALRIAGHYGLVHRADNPLTATPAYYGPNATLTARIEPLVMPGAIYVTEDFATALFARGNGLYRVEFVGDLIPLRETKPVRLFALSASAPSVK